MGVQNGLAQNEYPQFNSFLLDNPTNIDNINGRRVRKIKN